MTLVLREEGNPAARMGAALCVFSRYQVTVEMDRRDELV